MPDVLALGGILANLLFFICIVYFGYVQDRLHFLSDVQNQDKIIISAFQKSWTTSLSGMVVLQYKRHWLALFLEFFYSTTNHFGSFIFGIQMPKLCNTTTNLFVVFSGFKGTLGISHGRSIRSVLVDSLP